jgi:NADH dehydrogenase FAD-containing subunit
VAQNIVSRESGKKLKPYKPTSGPMGFITIGRKKGIGQLPFGRMDFMIAMKQKDMFVSRFLAPPK